MDMNLFKNILNYISLIIIFIITNNFIIAQPASPFITYCSMNNFTQVSFLSEIECNEDPWVLVFNDDFNSFESSHWAVKSLLNGGDLQDENTTTQQYYSVDNIKFTNDGKCHLVAKEETVERLCTDWISDPDTILLDNIPNLRTYFYTSARLQTKYSFGFGRYEIRCRLPKGQGFFPAFWLFGGYYGWSEIDIFEFWNEGYPELLSRVLHMNIHIGNDPNTESCDSEDIGPDYSAGFHTFTMIWNPFEIEWQVDGVPIRRSFHYSTMNSSVVNCNTMTSLTPYLRIDNYPTPPMDIIMNFAIKRDAEAPDATTPFPSSYDIDYVRYYKQIPCNGDITVNAANPLILDAHEFNVLLGTTVTFDGDINIPSGKQLEIIARDEIIFLPGFSTEIGSEIETKFDNSICYNMRISNTGNVSEKITDKIDSNKTSTSKIKFYPNPASDNITVDISDQNVLVNLLLKDVRGNVIKRLIEQTGNRININVEDIVPGVYILQIESAIDRASTCVFKFIKF